MNDVQDKDICGEEPSIALTNFVAELHDALMESDYRSAAVALTNCIVLTYAEHIKPLDYQNKDD